MKVKTVKSIAFAMSLAMMSTVGGTVAFNPIVAYAAEIDSVAFQEAINAEGSNITAVPYSPTEGETPDLYCVDNWTVDENGCTYTANQVYKGTFGDKYYGNGMIYLNIPEDGKIRTLQLSATFSDIYGGLKIYADGYSADNGKLIYEYADTSSNEFTDKEIVIGNEGTDFYIVTNLNSLSSVTLSNMSLTTIDSLTYDVGDEATAVYQDGILTISGTGTVEDISAIPDIVKNNIKTLIIEEGITSIINDAFSGLSSITYIDFPSTLEYLEGYVFRDCTGLTEIYLDCPNLQLNGSVFMGCINVSKVYLNISNEIGVNSNEESTYAVNNGYMYSASTGEGGTCRSPFQGIGSNTGGIDIVFGEDMTLIGEGLFWGAYSIKSITIPDSVNTMGVYLHGIGKYLIFATTAQIGTTSLYTNNQTALDYDWNSDGLSISTASYEESDVIFNNNTDSDSGSGGNTSGGNTGDSGNGGSGGSSDETDIIDPKEESMTITGTVQPITTMDITLELDGISFAIDSDRNFTGQSGRIINSSSFPIDVYLMNIEGKTGIEPAIVENDKYTEKEWNNLSVRDTLSYMAISINELNLSQIYNNTEFDSSKMLKLGNLKSAYEADTSLELVPSALYGKNFGNVDELSVLYDLVIEFIIP